MKKILTFFLVAVTALLVGCVTAPPVNYSVQNVEISGVKFDADLRSLTIISGSPQELKLNVPHDLSLVLGDWKEAVQNALDRSIIFDDHSAIKVNLTVKILGMDIPGGGISMTTRSIAVYELIDRSTGEVIFSTEVDTLGEVFGDYSFYGIVRARESINRSVQNNIKEFLTRLQQEARDRS